MVEAAWRFAMAYQLSLLAQLLWEFETHEVGPARYRDLLKHVAGLADDTVVRTAQLVKKQKSTLRNCLCRLVDTGLSIFTGSRWAEKPILRPIKTMDSANKENW